jgi:hypothetical protein
VHIAFQRLPHVLTGTKTVRLEHVADAPVEAFDHAVGLRRLGLGQTVFDAEGLAELIKFVLATISARMVGVARAFLCRAMIMMKGAPWGSTRYARHHEP